jgi:purine-nucleoside/S-methyl-5'-thioadenosine phosphorylase / adenosine deaminase
VDLPEPFRIDDDHITAELPGARLVFSTRKGGVSEGAYASLNLGLLTDDAPENVRENRRRLGEAVGHPWERFCYGRQVHGATVRRATEPPSAERPYTHEDGQATTLTDAAAIVFVADCLPVLLAAPEGVAALHCGWRPLAAGIIEEGVKALRELGAGGEIQAAIGPGARGCCYEVGEEVHEQFARYDARRMERNLDLPAIATQQLHDAGVHTVHDTGVCSMCWFGLFFSHRRDRGITGRQAGVVCRA